MFTCNLAHSILNRIPSRDRLEDNKLRERILPAQINIAVSQTTTDDPRCVETRQCKAATQLDFPSYRLVSYRHLKRYRRWSMTRTRDSGPTMRERIRKFIRRWLRSPATCSVFAWSA